LFDVFVITLGAVIGGFCVLRELARIYGRPRPPRYPMPNLGVQPSVGTPSGYASLQPTTLYHGTTRQNALEIYNSGLWMVGNSFPPAVWMAADFAMARGYAKGTGGVVIISVAPWVRLTNLGPGVFTYEIPNGQPWGEYYHIQGLKPVGVLDVNGNRVA
jgi:hypothetical protein